MSETPTLLVVDDDAELLALFRSSLSKQYRVVTESDAMAVEEVLEREQPAIVLLDYSMPRRSGIEVCSAIRANPDWDRIPILFITAYDMPLNRSEFYSAGANDFLGKPFDINELRAKVDVWVNLYQRSNLLIKQNKALAEQSLIDSLTGLANRRQGLEQLRREFARFQRYGTNCSILLLDIDGFKTFNESCGHEAGDSLLKEMASRLISLLRQLDLCARYGSNTFLLILPEADSCAAEAAARKFLHIFHENPLSVPKGTAPALSIGIAAISGHYATIHEWLDDSQVALQTAKTKGGDRFCLAHTTDIHDEEPSPSGSLTGPRKAQSMPVALVALADPDESRQVQETLQTWHYATLAAATADEVLDCLDGSTRPRILILDWNLPDKEGLVLCHELRQQAEGKPLYIIMATSTPTSKEIQRGLAAGADDFIRTPIAEEELQARIAVGRRFVNYEQRLSNSRQRYKRLVQSAPSAILRLNAHLRITFCNRFCMDLFRMTRDRIIGSTIRQALQPETDEFLDTILPQILSGPAQEETVELIHLLPEGERLRMLWNIAPVENREGHLQEILLVGNDITRRHEAEQALQHAERMASLGVIAGGIAHQFNNINAAIGGYAEILAADPSLPESSREYASIISESVHHSSRIIGRLIEFAQSGDGERAPVEVADLVHSVVDILETEMQDQGIELDVRLEEDLWCNMNRAEMADILMSMINNAKHAMLGLNDKSLRIEARRQGELARIAIADTGHGIKGEHLDKVFLPFFSTKGEHCEVSGSPQSRIKGAGLSLCTCDVSVRDHGGNIEVESTPGKGTTFTICLPTCKAPAT